MTTTKTLAMVCSLVVAAGCTHRYKETRYGTAAPDSYGATSSTYSGASNPSHAMPGKPGTTDLTLASTVKQTLQADPSFASASANIEVKAEHGTVTLTGTVPSEQQKQMIETKVRTTAGVANVNNQLQVSLAPTSDRSAQSSRIYSNATDQATSIFQDQTSKDTLSPTSDRPNTSRVYTTNRTESATPGLTQGTDSFAANIQGDTETDRALAQQLMQELRTDAEIVPLMSKVKINVSNGKATLTGTVQSEEQKQKLESCLQKVSGITSVDNQLQTGSSEPGPYQKKADQEK